MLERSNAWKTMVANGAFAVETRASFSGASRTRLDRVTISRALSDGPLPIGKAVTASLNMTVLPQGAIPTGAEVVMTQAIRDAVDYTQLGGEWLSAGTFYVAQRQVDPVSGRLILQCYDAMLKANAPYLDLEFIGATITGQQAVQDIAAAIGCSVHTATLDAVAGQYMTYTNIVTMQAVLEWLAAACGGNFVVSPKNYLEFVPLRSASDIAEYEGDNIVNVIGAVGAVRTGAEMTVTGLTATTAEGATVNYGTSTGAVIDLGAGNPFLHTNTIQTLFAALDGIVYAPYTIQGGYYDPAVEIGDYVVAGNTIASILVSETANYDKAFRGDISAPGSTGIADEYPYINAGEKIETLSETVQKLVTIVADKASIREIEAVSAQLQNLSVDDIRAGIIHSGDYSVETMPFIYPDTDQYPETNLNPSNGESVVKGFAIDFATGEVYGGLYNLGKITVKNPASTSVPNESLTSLTSVSLEEGAYVIEATADFATDANGYRQIGLASSATSANSDRYRIARMPAVDGAHTSMTLTFPTKTTSAATIYLNVYQNSGSSLNVTGGLRVIRLN